MSGSMPAFVRGAKKLFLLKLEGEASFGIRDQKREDGHGCSVYLVQQVDRLSPADRSGIARGDQLLTVKVLGVDKRGYPWSDAALERLQAFHEIHVIEICVKKPDRNRLTDMQQQHRDRISQYLTKAKEIDISGKQFRDPFILSQLERIVVLLYDHELKYFAELWEALPDRDRTRIAPPIARAFVSEARLPGLRSRRPPATPMPSLPSTPQPTPPASPAPTDGDATESLAGTVLSDVGHTDDDISASTSDTQEILISRPRLRTAAGEAEEKRRTRRRIERLLFEPGDEILPIKSEPPREESQLTPATLPLASE